MINQSPFRNNSANARQTATRKKAFYLIIAAAVLLSSAPVAYMILNGWLGSTEPNADELITDEYYEEISEPEPEPAPETDADSIAPPEAQQTSSPLQQTPVSSISPDAQVQNTAAPGAPEAPRAADNNTVQATAITATAPVNTVTEPPIQPVQPPANDSATAIPAVQSPIEPVASAASSTPPTPAAPVPPPPVPVDIDTAKTGQSAKTATAAESAEQQPKQPQNNQTETDKKRVLRPLSPQELAALKAANDQAAAAKNNASPRERNKYGEKLFSHVRSKWYPPSPYQVNNRKLKAVIELNIASDGKVNSVKFITPSYVKPMDDSIRNLMNNLRQDRAPAPGTAAGIYRIELKN